MNAPVPGEFPYEAGLHPTGYTTRRWTMRQLAGLGEASSTNERFRYLLGMGETGLSLAFDLPTQLGMDPDTPGAENEVGQVGVSIATVEDLAAVFAGIPLDKVSVSFTINATAPILLAMWIVVAEESGVDPAKLRGTLQNEILKEFLARKAFIYDVDTSFRYSLDLIEYCVRTLPHVNPISISGGHVREAGCSRALEVACAIADADEYLRGLTARGLPVDEVAPSFSFIFGTHMELLAEASKFRVARRMYAKRMRSRWGATQRRSTQMRIQVNTFGSALAYQEPLNNVARSTIQALAAVLGGIQSLHVCSFDEAHQTPGSLGARIALRVQQILAEETDLCRYKDPLGGSLAIEQICDELEGEVGRWLARIDEGGGMLQAIRDGWLEGEVENIAYGDPGPRVGVHDTIASANEDELLRRERKSAKATTRLRAVERRPCTAELARVREDALAGRNVMPALVEAVRARATVGQLTEALRPESSTHHDARRPRRTSPANSTIPTQEEHSR